MPDESVGSYPTQSSSVPFDGSSMLGYPQLDYSHFDLVKATQYGILERCVQLLEKEGVDVKQVDKENVTALHWAAINNRIQIAE